MLHQYDVFKVSGFCLFVFPSLKSLKNCRQEGDRLFHNAEMGPAAPGQDQSQLNILTVSQGEFSLHCNKYLRLPIEEVKGLIIDSSNDRMTTFTSFPPPKNREDVIRMLGDQSNSGFKVFGDGDQAFIKTICVGIFDCKKRTLSLYSDNPKTNDPLIVIPLVIKEK